MKTTTISLITQKGGVGKTTSTIHLGGCLAELGNKVLIIDFDTQMNLSLGNNIDDFSYNIVDFVNGNNQFSFIEKGNTGNLFVLPGSADLKEKSLTKNSLAKSIQNLNGAFDFILIDCPPKPINEDLSLGEIAVNASNYVLSPIKADKYSIAGIITFLASINDLRRQKNVDVKVLGFFFNEVEENTNHFMGFYSVLKESPASTYLLNNYIRKDVAVKNAMDEGKTVFEIKPKSRASQDFKNLTNEILNKINNNEHSKR